MSFQQGLSGLNASAKALDTIGNNIANSGTVGFKGSSAQFSDVFAASLVGGGGSPIGLGAKLADVAQQFTQGNITVTNNALDMAINGGGFFMVEGGSGEIMYTRNGQFQLDKDGYIITSSGQRLMGYPTGSSGGTPEALQLVNSASNADAAPQATGGVTGVLANVNLDSRATVIPDQGLLSGTPTNLVIDATNNTLTVTVDGSATPVTVTIPPDTYADAADLAAAIPAITGATVSESGGKIVITSDTVGLGSSVSVSGTAVTSVFGASPVSIAGSVFDYQNAATYTKATSATVYDSLGNSHTMQLYFRKTDAGADTGEWDVYTGLDAGAPVASLTNPTHLVFNSSGVLTTSADGIIPQSFTVTSGATSPMEFDLNLTGSTQYGSTFTVNSLTQDGYASGKLAKFTIGSDGVILGSYTNGQTREIGQLVLANFVNAQGLQPAGNNSWVQTSDAGALSIGTPGSSGSFGPLQSSALEDSNVDLTAELVNMITQQRAYQANAQTIKTQDQVLQTLVNLR